MFLTYLLHLNSYLLTFLLNTISRAQLLCPFLLSLLLWNSKHTVSWHRARSQALIACFNLPVIRNLPQNYWKQENIILCMSRFNHNPCGHTLHWDATSSCWTCSWPCGRWKYVISVCFTCCSVGGWGVDPGGEGPGLPTGHQGVLAQFPHVCGLQTHCAVTIGRAVAARRRCLE